MRGSHKPSRFQTYFDPKIEAGHCIMLDLCGPAKIFLGIRNPPAVLANEFWLFYQFLVIFEAVFEIPHIDQVAQMFVMHGVWHLGLIHIHLPFLQ